MFDVCEAQDRPVFFLYEKYVDEDAFRLHLAAPHCRDFDRASSSWVSEKTVERFSLLRQTSRT
ncbi:putative quinol monooxygenase [Caballeronia ptereochthonis]|uniref:putative quinol monooxygenase n=1 Tax=Caballeronia ptereochthonis TaxID=1777144 RepID=UPI001FC9C4CF|nr:antibiotic biosynthesis monooxygenase [Caballeronia ptereochthonis]